MNPDEPSVDTHYEEFVTILLGSAEVKAGFLDALRTRRDEPEVAAIWTLLTGTPP